MSPARRIRRAFRAWYLTNSENRWMMLAVGTCEVALFLAACLSIYFLFLVVAA